MAEITKTNGISDCTCNGAHWIVVHDSVKLYFHGRHAGQLTSPKTIEYYGEEIEMWNRIIELGVYQNEEMVERMTELGLI